MAEQIVVAPAEVLPTVLSKWDLVSAQQINALADQLYRDLSLDDAL